MAAAAHERLTRIAGTLRHEAANALEMPAVGDWVAAAIPPGLAHGVIHAIVPRRSAFVRRAPGDDLTMQVVAANVDTVFLVTGLDDDYNLRRLERYLTLTWESGARPVVLLNKSDLEDAVEARRVEVEAIAPGVAIHVLSALDRSGVEALSPYLAPGQTVALLGSSGAGKSTLVNALLGEERQRTREVRASDHRGRHTTTHRELITLPGGALVMDTPGMRELQLWDAAPALQDAFSDIDSVGALCRFRDCGHGEEPGCAVRAAVEAGTLGADRLASFHKLKGETKRLQTQQDKRAQAAEGRRVRTIHKAVNRFRPRG